MNAQIVTYHNGGQVPDASNLYQGPEDVMQACEKCKKTCVIHAGVYENDSQIESHDRSRRERTKGPQRVDIILTPYIEPEDTGQVRPVW
jgi:hypothetical protein